MAETLTVDTTPEVGAVGEVAGVQLSADEQDSLAVGEQMEQASNERLAGKYANAQELEKAYIELQKKLGEDGKEEDTPEAEQEEVLSEESEEGSEEFSEAADLISLASEEWESSGELTTETMEAFSEMSSADLVNAYIELQQSGKLESDEQESVDISNAAVNEVKNFAGGEQQYQNLVNWASQNLDQNSIEAFDGIIGTGNVDAIKLAVSGLQSQYENANGYEGRMVTGKSPTDTKDVYRSQAELVKAMSDRRYDDDPAYRQDVMAKLERSDNLLF